MMNQHNKTKEEMIAEIQTMDGATLITFLKSQNKSDAYVIMRDIITDIQKRDIKRDTDLYCHWKDLDKDTRIQWDYDHKQATMMDVNRAVTNVYTLALKMIRALDEHIIMSEAAINRIEEKLGMDITQFTEEPQQSIPQTKEIKESEEEDRNEDGEGEQENN